MYLRTLDTLPISYIENNLTLAELDGNITTSNISKFIDSKEEVSSTVIKEYEITSKVNIGGV